VLVQDRIDRQLRERKLESYRLDDGRLLTVSSKRTVKLRKPPKKGGKRRASTGGAA
jgi:hypothetical protein